MLRKHCCRDTMRFIVKAVTVWSISDFGFLCVFGSKRGSGKVTYETEDDSDEFSASEDSRSGTMSSDNSSEESLGEVSANEVESKNLDFSEIFVRKYSDQKLGDLEDGYNVFMSTHPPSLMAKRRSYQKWRDDCQERFLGLPFDSVGSQIPKILDALNAIEYVPCQRMGHLQTGANYDIRASTRSDADGIVSIECRYTEKATGRRLGAIRTGKRGFFKDGVFEKHIRKQEKSIVTNTNECIDMLPGLIYLDSKLVDLLYDPNVYANDSLKLEADDVKIVKTEKEEAIGAGYIVMIVLGVLILLGGTYYAYSEWSSSKPAPLKNQKKQKRTDKN